MDGDTVDVGVVDEPDDLVGEQLCIVLRVQVWLSWLARVQLQTLSDALSQHIQGWVCLHYLLHRLLKESLSAIEPAAVARVKVVS